MNKGIVKSVSKSGTHTFNKFNCERIVLEGGEVKIGSRITVELPLKLYVKLERV